MPQILFFAAIAAIGYFGYKRFVAEAERVSARVREQEREAKNGAVGTLKQDPETGEYRVVKDED